MHLEIDANVHLGFVTKLYLEIMKNWLLCVISFWLQQLSLMFDLK